MQKLLEKSKEKLIDKTYDKTFLLLTGELVAWWAADSLPVAPSVTDNQNNESSAPSRLYMLE